MTPPFPRWFGPGLLLVLAALPTGAEEPRATPLLAKIKAVRGEGAGNPEAARAWRELVKLGPAALIDTLAAIDDDEVISANWLRTAADAIAERQLTAKRPLPADRLEAFVKDTKHAGSARRLAYDWLVRVDPTAPGRLLPGFLNDPAAELRRDAVALVIQEAQQLLDKGDNPAATAAFARALVSARDRDQVSQIAEQLRKLGVNVDLAAQLGFVRNWLVIGPFDNVGGVGFKAVYAPEKAVEPQAVLVGKEGRKLSWAEHATTDPYGIVDLNRALGKNMGAVGYAYAVVMSPAEQTVQFRVGSNNSIKLFLNGQMIFAHEEYHHGWAADQYIARGKLRAGRNELLVKVCQNEQTDSWAQNWSFQLRICDGIGGPVPLKIVAEKAVEKPEGGKQ